MTFVVNNDSFREHRPNLSSILSEMVCYTESYTENILSLSNPALKLFSDLASLTFIGSLFQTILFRKNSPRNLQILIGSLCILVPSRMRL